MLRFEPLLLSLSLRLNGCAILFELVRTNALGRASLTGDVLRSQAAGNVRTNVGLARLTGDVLRSQAAGAMYIFVFPNPDQMRDHARRPLTLQ